MPEIFSLNSSPVSQDNYLNFRLHQHLVAYLTMSLNFRCGLAFRISRESAEVVLGCQGDFGYEYYIWCIRLNYDFL